MIDARISLAMAMHAHPGVYAVLLGSGVSRTANIPTGWEIVSDMIRRIAMMVGEDAEPDAEAWYTAKYGIPPTYSGLLEAIGRSQAERSGLLRGYFEPSENEQENGDKRPTKAHIAIARLVKKHIVRVVLTTNFDRLMEQALEAEGVAPTVISTPESIDGASPMVHSPCTLIKLHGDYMDLRTKNTQPELNVYDPRLDGLLDRVFDEYGLIVCGWSGEWDEALCKAMERRKGRRFSAWWTSLGNLSETSKRLVDFCNAEVIPIQSADEFFENLSENLDALERFDRPHPISVKMAVTLTKKYIAESKHKIELNDLLMDEVEKIVQTVNSDQYPRSGNFCDANYADRIRSFDALSEIAMHIVAIGCFWDEKAEYSDIWIRAISRLANMGDDGIGGVGMRSLMNHPARLLLYAAGIAFAARSNFSAVFKILSETKARTYNGDRALSVFFTNESCWADIFKSIPDLKNHKIPVSDHCFDVLKPVIRVFLSSETEYTYAFDLFEILQSFYDAEIRGRPWCIPGAYMYRESTNSPFAQFVAEVRKKKEESGFLRAGFCGGNFAKFERASSIVEKVLQRYYF